MDCVLFFKCSSIESKLVGSIRIKFYIFGGFSLI